MKVFYAALITAAMMAAAGVPAALAQAPAGATYMVTYLEVLPSAKAQAEKLLKEVAAASRKEDGNQRFDILERTEHTNQFAILEAWNDPKAAEAHVGGDVLKQFRDKFKPLQIGPYDQRPSVGIDVSAGTATTKGAIYAITHVDVTPNFKDDAITMLKALAADSRKEAASERFEVWQQNNRANHFTVTETWKNMAGVDAHVIAAATRDFREKLGPMSGALYDQRLYKNLEH
jgi:quinol monooxygenase YgiN